MNQIISINNIQVQVLAYFEFEAIRSRYLIYWDPKKPNIIYLGNVIEKDDVIHIYPVDKTYAFVLRAFIKEATENKMNTLKGYHYCDKLSELYDITQYHGSQAIELDSSKRSVLERLIHEVNDHNPEILKQAKNEYYIQLIDQKENDRRTVIILSIVLVVALSLIAFMVVRFLMK